MKKLFVTLMALCTASMMLFAGCGNKPYNYDLTDYVTVGEYMNLEIDKPGEIKVTSSEIDDAIKEDLEANQYLVDVSDGKVHEGDTVNIDFVGTVDGKEFENGSAESQSIVIGSSGYIDGFDDGLIGKKVGATVDLNLTFPDDYSTEDLAGKDVVFKVTINTVQEYKTPKYTTEFVKDKTDYDDKKSYEDAKEKELYSQKETEQENDTKTELWQKVIDASEVKSYPEKELQAYKDSMKANVTKYAEQYEMEYADFLETYYNMTEEEFDKQLDENANTEIESEMICYYIADKEGLSVSEDEYSEYIKNYLSYYGMSESDFEEQAGSTVEEYLGGEDYVKYTLLLQKVQSLILENCKYV